MGVPSMQLLAAKAGGAAAFVPTDIAGCIAWWDASDASTFTYTSGSLVDTWADKSGNSRTLTTMAAGREPDRARTVNGLSALDFSPNDTMRTADPGATELGTAATIFAVVATDTTGGASSNLLSAGYSTGASTFYRSGTSWGLYTSGATTGGSISSSTNYVMQATFNGASSTIRQSGGASVISGNPGTSSWRGFTVGSYVGGATDTWDGTICEILVYDSALSLANINAVGTYLAAKWGITWSTAT